ncbi:carboxypeptidase-like regulatory domain-containing protein [Solimonas sp. SE-A11]|uniref:carboxypeptidase-like regulatory domain-containing protein n=1 Tax=Solimonas sp. SE-A11 TaxID=3054954 RepID=UPI00259C835B|nr:carboxypeptidase-like regulatory domain-containing protein [Solimonas sp. SE-A11]MDM4769131.1 carboxypeptidase-like regulatory domain-containing protein [Solimonas sp. SE-A11]
MSHRRHAPGLAALLLAASLSPALAQGGDDCNVAPPAIAVPPPAATPGKDWTPPSTLLPVQQAGTLRYITGGIGEDSAVALRALRGEYPVAITFGLRDGGRNQFTAGVTVAIDDAADRHLLSVITEGPYLYVDLPPGDYLLKAAAPSLGPAQQRRFQLRPGRHIDLLLLWEAPR